MGLVKGPAHSIAGSGTKTPTSAQSAPSESGICAELTPEPDPRAGPAARHTLDKAFQLLTGRTVFAGCGVWQVLVIGSQNCPFTAIQRLCRTDPGAKQRQGNNGSGGKTGDDGTAYQMWHALILPARRSGNRADYGGGMSEQSAAVILARRPSR